MIKYHQDTIDFPSLPENNIDRIQLAMIPENSRVLEIGCATGYMAEYLSKEKGCRVTGIEPSPGQADAAITRGITVYKGYIDEKELQSKLDQDVVTNKSFDVIFMSQVIEHIADPESILRRLQDWLTPEGLLIISTCNVAHWKSRLKLLLGKWEYTDYGIFDKTHLRFFTINSFEKMLRQCRYTPLDCQFTFEDICPFKLFFDTRILAPSDLLRIIPFAGKPLRKAYLQLVRNFVATQFVFKASPLPRSRS